MIWFPLLLGYLLGCFLPAYFLVRWIAGIDVRTIGTHHAGTTNVYRAAGLAPAVLTALYDGLKGILAVSISNSLGYPQWISYMSGFCAIIGHIFPFYIGFRGGKGAATTTGLLLMALWELSKGIPIKDLTLDLLVLLSLVLILLYTTKKGDIIGFFVLPALAILIGIRTDFSKSWFADILISILLIINLRNISEYKLFKFTEDIRAWRIYIKPFSLILFCLSFLVSHGNFLILTGTVLLIFLITDIVRLVNKKVHGFFHTKMVFKIYKEKEKREISSMSFFLLSTFIVFFLFERNIAFLSMLFLAFGDLTAKLVGMSFGRKRFFGKTIEGSLTCFIICFYSSYLMSITNLVDLRIGIVGAITATASEIFPLGVDDNLSVPIFSALMMSLWKVL